MLAENKYTWNDNNEYSRH